MASSLTELVARLRVAGTTGRVTPTLAQEAIDALLENTPTPERCAARDELLLRAARLMTGSRWAKEQRIRRDAAGGTEEADEITELVRAAIVYARLPKRRRLLEILAEAEAE